MADIQPNAAVRSTPNLYSISAGQPFLPTLVTAMVSGTFGPRLDPAADPMAFADVTILLPTRRAVTALQREFMERFAQPSLILPRIRPLGDIDDADTIDTMADLEQGSAEPLTPLSIDPMQRLLMLTQIVRRYRERLAELQHAAGIVEQARVPASLPDAAWLARDLANLIDYAATERLNWHAVKELVPDQFAAHWELTATFLDMIGSHWPQILADIGRTDPGNRRNLLLAAECARLKRQRGQGLVLAAGSTGSVPATAELLEVIAALPNGAVVLPGLDFDLQPDAFEAIETDPTVPADLAASHPQFALKRLLQRFGIDRDEVIHLGESSTEIVARQHVLSIAMMPVSHTHTWPDLVIQSTTDTGDAFAGVEVLEAAGPQEEAQWIALAIRGAMDAGKSCALVTTDTGLSRRVKAELAHWALEIEDSRGTPLSETKAAQLVRLLARWADDSNDPHVLLAILKHPLCRAGFSRIEVLRLVAVLERGSLRQPAPQDGLTSICARLQALRETLTRPSDDQRSQLRGDRRKLSATQVDKALDFAHSITSILAPLTLSAKISLPTQIAALRDALDRLTTTDDATPGSGGFTASSGGPQILALLDKLQADPEMPIDLTAGEFAGFLEVALADQKVPPAPPQRPRYQILGTLESRLLHFDHVIIAGLNEGSWPQAVETDAWLSRPMRAQLKLDPPEQRTGLAAHDFCQLMGARQVTITRSLLAGGAPTQPARWLRRLDAFLGKDRARALRQNGVWYRRTAEALTLARQLERQARGRPSPASPVRPSLINVTDIELLIRDPYAFYAKNILKLRRLDDLARAPGAAERGTFIHNVLDQFVAAGPNFADPVPDSIYSLGALELHGMDIEPATRIRWMRWLERVAELYLAFERSRSSQTIDRLSEITGQLVVHVDGTELTIFGRADRIDVIDGQTASIFDFKTGQPPSAKQVLSGFAPQIAVEAAIFQAGGFDLPASGNWADTLRLTELGFMHLSDRRQALEIKSALDPKLGQDAGQLGLDAGDQLQELLRRFVDPAYLFASRTRPQFETRYESDYDHLARVNEWADDLAEDE